MQHEKTIALDEDDGQEEMEAVIRASLASFEREQSASTKVTEIIELEEETSAEDASRAKELLHRVAELQERNETLRQKLLSVNEKNDPQGGNPDDELERAIKLSLQQPAGSDKDTKPASRSTLFSEDLLQGQDIDRIGDGSTFFLNRIRGLPPTGNENTLTFKQIIQAVRKSFVNNENILTFNQKF